MAYIETNLYKALGSYLRIARESSGFTLSEVSKRMDTTLMTIQRYEKGDRKITIEKIRALCSIYGVNADQLMQDSIDSLKQTSNTSPVSLRESKLLSTFRLLNLKGQEKAMGYIDGLVASGNFSDEPVLIQEDTVSYNAIAAHERTDIEVTDEMRAADDAIMEDDDF